MVNTIMYQLSNGTSDVYFTIEPKSPNRTITRTIWEMPIPYLHDEFIFDQITSTPEISITAKFTPGPGMPYATTIDSYSAIALLTPDSYSPGWSLKGGDWNGATWADNPTYPHRYGAGATKMLVTMVRTDPETISYETGVVMAIITLKEGTVF